MNLAAELAENAAFTIVSLNDLCDRGVLCGPIRMKLYKQKGTALCGAPLHTGLAPPAFTAPCRNQTSVATPNRNRHARRFGWFWWGFRKRRPQACPRI